MEPPFQYFPETGLAAVRQVAQKQRGEAGGKEQILPSALTQVFCVCVVWLTYEHPKHLMEDSRNKQLTSS